jgi:hypothetical protein
MRNRGLALLAQQRQQQRHIRLPHTVSVGMLSSKRSKMRMLFPSTRHVAHSAPLSPAASAPAPGPYKKKAIPKALREALWLKTCGKSFEVKCLTTWCQNRITAYDFQAGHNVPEVRGGATTLENLVPICSRCNLSMGSQYTFDEWCKLEGGSNDPVVVAPSRRTSWFTCCQSIRAVTPEATPYAHPTYVGPSGGPAVIGPAAVAAAHSSVEDPTPLPKKKSRGRSRSPRRPS